MPPPWGMGCGFKPTGQPPCRVLIIVHRILRGWDAKGYDGQVVSLGDLWLKEYGNEVRAGREVHRKLVMGIPEVVVGGG